MTRLTVLTGTFLALGLSACAPQYIERVAQTGDALPERIATFPDSPERLIASFRAACNDPGDVYARPGSGIRQCRSLPGPDLAAFLLVKYDGALKAPTLVIQTQERAKGNRVELGFSYFAEVPQKSGRARRIYFRSSDIDKSIDKLLAAAGGAVDG